MPGLNLGLGLSLTGLTGSGGGGPVYDAAASTLFAAMSVQPDSTRKALINTTILALKSAGIWMLLDECWFLAAHDAQTSLLGWKRYKNCSAVNSPAFTADRGYTSDGATSYLDTAFSPASHGINFALNSSSLGVYIRTQSGAGANLVDIGITNANTAYVAAWNASGNTITRINEATDTSVANTNTTGLLVGRRTASNATSIYRNGSSIVTGAISSVALPSGNIYICCRNQVGTAALFTQRQYAFAFVAASLSAQQQADLYTIVQAYMTGVGANV